MTAPQITSPQNTTTTASRSWKSRAVLRLVQPGSWVNCESCGEQIKYQVRAQNMQMICNVYEDGVWSRVEHFHSGCYSESGEPYGPADDATRNGRTGRTRRAAS